MIILNKSLELLRTDGGNRCVVGVIGARQEAAEVGHEFASEALELVEQARAFLVGNQRVLEHLQALRLNRERCHLNTKQVNQRKAQSNPLHEFKRESIFVKSHNLAVDYHTPSQM